MSLYLDASAVAAIVLNAPAAPAVDQVVQSEADVIVTGFVVAEVSSAVARLHRMKTLPAPPDEYFALLDGWVAEFARLEEILDDDAWRAMLFVRTPPFKLRSPDALHLALCERLGVQLVTLDHNLADAAWRFRLPCINPADLSAL